MTILGINLRNSIIARSNPRSAIRLVNDKYATKCALAERKVPVPGTIVVISEAAQLRAFDWNRLPEAWALKPNRGRRGEGIMLAVTRHGKDWATASGRVLTRGDITFHIERVLDGEHSLEGLDRDSAMFEPLILPHPLIRQIVPEGLPDTRVICLGDEPIMAMMRIPTRASEGKANLHQGAIGAGIEMETGLIFRAVLGDDEITHHPDTGYALLGLQIPQWDEVLAASTRCGDALGLGYCGADIVLDAEHGPLVLECNAFPGLQIQNVNGRGLKGRIQDLGLERKGFWSRFRRAPVAHPHVLTKEQSVRRLGPAPLHAGYSATEAVQPAKGRTPFNFFASLGAIRWRDTVDPVAGEAAARFLAVGDWEDRGVGAGGSMILLTTGEQRMVVIGAIIRGADGRATFMISHARAISRSHQTVTGDGRMRILLADDDGLLSEFIRYQLERAGYSVVTALDGDEALTRLKVVTPSAIILDGDMPGADGFDVLRKVRETPATRAIPVLMLTARRDVEQIGRAFELGADEYVTKPFEAEELLARLSRLLSPD